MISEAVLEDDEIFMLTSHLLSQEKNPYTNMFAPVLKKTFKKCITIRRDVEYVHCKDKYSAII
jgi:hypothetical protein